MSAVSDVQILLNDAGVFWPVQRVLDALNEAQWDIWVRSKWTKFRAPFPLIPGDDIVALPSGMVIPQFVEDNALRYFPSTQRSLEAFHRTWKLDQPGQPMYFVLWDAFNVRVYPTPDQDYNNYVMWGIGYPPEVTTTNYTTATISGDDTYVKAIYYATCAILLDATRPELAAAYRQMSDTQLMSYQKHLRNQQSHNIRRLRPGGRFDLQQSGNVRELPVYYPLEC